MKKPLEEARTHILKVASQLRDRKIADLRSLVANSVREQLQISGVHIDVSTWAKEHGHDKLAVIVEARRHRFLGWSQVTADGFYIDSAGVISDFTEKDYCEHGY